MRDNIVAGSERSGYSIVGVSCAETDAQWSGNVAHGTLTGQSASFVLQLPVLY